MAQADNLTGKKDFVPPSLSELTSRYLQRQADAHAAGLAVVDATGEVQPYEAGPVQPIDARLAWDETLAVLKFFGVEGEKPAKALPGWPTLVASHEPVFDLALSLGNFPQLVRNLHPLLQAKNLGELRKSGNVRPLPTAELASWAAKAAQKPTFPQMALAVGALRLAREYDRADELIRAGDDAVPAAWQAVWENEKAALAWHRGRQDEARKSWLTQADSTPVLFNRGMSALFLGNNAAAREALTRAVGQLPERSAWYHLARLYLTLAQR